MPAKSIITLSVLALACCFSLSALNEVSFCPAGVHGDGFVDWTKLPKAPTSGSVNATIPVTGIPGLTATFQIPSSTPNNPGAAYYTANNPASLTVANGVDTITVLFNKPVQGVSVTFQTGGRFGHDFKMTAYDATNEIGFASPAQVDSNGADLLFQQFSASPLQIRSASADLVAVRFQYAGDIGEYFFYNLVNFRVESGLAPDPAKQVPTNGLKEWLRADRTNLTFGGFNVVGDLTSWPDQSGNGSDALPQGTSPVVLDGPNCTQVVGFNGNKLAFNLPINGWTGMTVFLAGQSYADAVGWWEKQALLWNETAPWGTTFFNPSQTNAFFRFGTTQVGNQPIYARPVDIGGDFGVTTAIHNGSTDSLYVNGLLVLQQNGKNAAISGTSSTATIGAGLLNTYFAGNIGEILIYDRALSDAERAVVEHYLVTKYGVQ